jgi:IS30 family transposase
MPRWAHNKMPADTKRRYFQLIREGHKGAEAARRVHVSTSCGSLWFLDAGGVLVPDPGPISPRFLTQDDRIAIADGVRSGDSATIIAVTINKSFQTVYRELRRNSKPDGSYQPWWAHNQALRRRQRPKVTKLVVGPKLRAAVERKLKVKWSPQQISRYLHRAYPTQPGMQVCAETIYLAIFAGTLGAKKGKIRTGRCYRKRHRRGVAVPNKIKNMRLVDQRPAAVADRAADLRKSPLSIAEIPQVSRRDVGLEVSLGDCQAVTAGSTSSCIAIGASQSGQQPPTPTRRMNVEQVSHLCSPRARSPQRSHS